MPSLPSEVPCPAVSVIVPARNEEDCLATCLKSLISQQGIAFEIIVVDDHSTDHTRQIAESFPQVKVIDAGKLPAGWTGKANAVTCGAQRAQAEWLLFTDADTFHQPGSLARAMLEAADRKVDLLSYSPEQEVHTFVEKSAMPVIFAELARRYRPSQVSDPESDAAAANGQYVLVSRRAYEAVGGHAAVAGSLLEDVELARAIKRSGRPIYFRLAADQVRARMYRSTAQLVEGWTKNLVLLFPSPFFLAALRASEFLAICAAAVLASVLVPRWQSVVCGVLALLLVYRLHLRIRRAHFPARSTWFAICGLPIFSFLLIRSAIQHKRGVVTWKGRQYSGRPTP